MKHALNLAAILLALAATFAIASCAGLADPVWGATSFRPTMIHIAYTDDLAPCGQYPNTLGCAMRTDDGKFRDCFVWVKKSMPAWRVDCVLRHEIRDHCLTTADHDDRPTNECGVG